MRIVADEGIERPLVLRLRASGHDVIHIAEIARGSTVIRDAQSKFCKGKVILK